MTEELNEYILLASEAQDMETLTGAMLNFARIMCEKQKEICADNAEADWKITEEMKRNGDFTFEGEVYVLKQSIIQCKNATEI